MYIRLSRDKMRPLYAENETFEIGKGKVVRDGSDVTIIACGVMCGQALEAADILAGDGISTRVVDMFTVKPIDADLVHRCARETRAIVTAEEHSIVGGLGGAVAEALGGCETPVPLERIGVDDCFTETGSYLELLAAYKLDAQSIAAKAKAALKRAKNP